MGTSTTASGGVSTAMGYQHQASSFYSYGRFYNSERGLSTAMGYDTFASNTTAMGLQQQQVEIVNSDGRNTTASGDKFQQLWDEKYSRKWRYSTAMGLVTTEADLQQQQWVIAQQQVGTTLQLVGTNNR